MEYPGSGAGPNAVPVYVVKDKDTVESLSFKYDVPIQTIVSRNKLQPPHRLRPGQTLEMPGAKYVPDSEPGTTAVASTTPGPVKREGLAPPPSQGEAPRSAAPAASAAPAGQPTPLSPAAPSVTVAAKPPRFVWPVSGKVVANYGTATAGQKNDGIDIETAKGGPVKAADSGTVVYAGNEVRGMGNLVLVSHKGGWITAYANNESLDVKKGDTVKKGQVIAKADPRVHFEVRRSGKTVDPMTVLPAQ
jgi:murein DD-endopeptidase MepM/ murein hydrolase activator NlpD